MRTRLVQAFYFKYNRLHPTPTEVRHSFYSAIVHGATGISLWGIGDNPGVNNEDIRGTLSIHVLWQAVGRYFRELRGIIPVIVSEEPVTSKARSANDKVVLMQRRYEDHDYLFAGHNRLRGGEGHDTFLFDGLTQSDYFDAVGAIIAEWE